MKICCLKEINRSALLRGCGISLLNGSLVSDSFWLCKILLCAILFPSVQIASIQGKDIPFYVNTEKILGILESAWANCNADVTS